MGTGIAILSAILEVIIAILLIVLLLRGQKQDSNQADHTGMSEESTRKLLAQSEQNLKSSLSDTVRTMGENVTNLQKANADTQSGKLNDIDRQLNQKLQDMETRQEKQISVLQTDTAAKLTAIQKIVDETLQSTVDQKMTNFGEMLSTNQKQASDAQRKQITDLSAEVKQTLTLMNQTMQEKQEQSSKATLNTLKTLETRFQSLESSNEQKLENMRSTMSRQLTNIQEENQKKLDSIQGLIDEKLQKTLDERMTSFGEMLSTNQKQASDAQRKQITDLSAEVKQTLTLMNQTMQEKQEQSSKTTLDTLKTLETRFQSLESSNEQKLENMRSTMSRQLTNIQEENQKKLDSIQNTVNEKLESQLQKSFQTVATQLETVHKSLGEMQSIATGVGDLKKVLSNVKTRGILGEIQLGSILEEILAPEQYDREVPTIKGSRERVEFAVKLPGNQAGETIYLPIDSKFPGDTYQHLVQAYDTGDKALIEAAKKNLITVIKKCAKDIKEKYVSPPDTTNFGILFLPFEGLYAEVVNLGLIETLQRDYNVNITGPSTMAAMLNALQMGFQTLAIQKKSSEVWEVLGAVKKEFATFQTVLDKAQKQIQTAGESIDKLVGTRTRAINRKLSTIETLDDADRSKKLLELPENL